MQFSTSHFARTFSIVAIAAAGALQIGASGAFAADPPRFVEEPGNLEFSGAMIARPVQDNAAANRAARDLILENFDVTDYVAPNDEFVFNLGQGQTENEVAAELLGTGWFEYVHPDWICYPQQCPSNDPLLGNQWHHSRIDSRNAWCIEQGRPHVTIAFCDTGVLTTHSDLRLNRKDGYHVPSRRWESQGGAVNDINGHGTHVNGTGAANGNNATGGSGIGWNLSHRHMRVTDSSGGGASLSNLTHGALTAIGQGDRVASVSYSGVNNGTVRTTATSIKNMGGLLFWAAGNSGANMSSPHRDADDLLVIGASTSSDTRASFSNYGNYVDFFAPGVNIYATVRSGGHGSMSGTSMATPIAAGVAALVFSADPSLTPDRVEEILKETCDNIGSESIFGYGRVNSRRAVEMAGRDPLTLEMQPMPLRGGGRVSFRISNAEPFIQAGVYYSTSGPGSTYVQELNVTLDLLNPTRAGPLQWTNADGVAIWRNLPVPNVNRRWWVWFQGAQRDGPTTEVIETTVEP